MKHLTKQDLEVLLNVFKDKIEQTKKILTGEEKSIFISEIGEMIERIEKQIKKSPEANNGK